MGVPEGKKLQIFISVYFLFLFIVPGNPSYYRLLVDTVGCLLSLVALLFLQLYLNSRPLNQKTVLHSQQHLIIYTQLVLNIRCWIVSAAGSVFRSVTIFFLNSFPRTFIALMQPRQYCTCIMIVYASTTVSKLILILSPASFQSLSASKGFWISLLATILLPLSDMLLNQIRCEVFTKNLTDPFEYTNIFREELGMENDIAEEVLGNITMSKGDSSYCAYFSTSVIFAVITLALEIIKLILEILFEIRKKMSRPQRIGTVSFPRVRPQPSHNPPAQPIRNHREVVLSPVHLEPIVEAHCSTQINVMPAPETETIEDLTENTAATLGERASVLEGSGAPMQVMSLTQEITNNFVEGTSVSVGETSVSNGEKSLSVGETAVTVGETAITFGETAVTVGETSGTVGETSGTVGETAVTVGETAFSIGETAVTVKEITNKTITLSETIKSTLGAVLLRPGTLSLVAFLIYLLGCIPILLSNSRIALLPHLLIYIIRFFAYFRPLVWILFDTDIRVYTFLKLRHIWQRFCN